MGIGLFRVLAEVSTDGNERADFTAIVGQRNTSGDRETVPEFFWADAVSANHSSAKLLFALWAQANDFESERRIETIEPTLARNVSGDGENNAAIWESNRIGENVALENDVSAGLLHCVVKGSEVQAGVVLPCQPRASVGKGNEAGPARQISVNRNLAWGDRYRRVLHSLFQRYHRKPIA